MNTTFFANKRKLAPDLARGFMLLFIALADANQFIFSTEREITFTDQLTVFIRQVVIDGRAFPLFAILFGYGLHQVWMCQERKGINWKDTKKIWVLSVFVANYMHRRSIRGPFKTFLRKKSAI